IECIGWTRAESVALPEGVDASLAKATPAPQANKRLITYNRQPIRGNIVHYSFQVQTGPGHYDVIGVHRVVKEKRPLMPINAPVSIFLQHGDAKDFSSMFIPGSRSSHMPNDFGFAVYLAENDVDVWGIDQAWTLVPEEETDFNFMADWGLQRQIDDLEYALAIARFTRLFTGSSFDQLPLLGYSSGVFTGYALLNQEAVVRPFLRNVCGFVPVDVPFKTDLQVIKDSFTLEYQRTKDELDQRVYGDWIPFKTIAVLARSEPEGDSPIFPGFTNWQTALYYASGPIFGPIPTHYWGGVWENDFPVDLRWVTLDECFDFLEAGTPWEAAKFINDYCKIMTDIEDTPWDDHLSQITVPILNVSAGGGFAEMTIYVTTLLGSTDVTHLIPRKLSVDEALYDLGHIDIFLSHESQSLIWEPLLHWLESHANVVAMN
ncbi:hypothetical protein JXA02_08245, partial [candidate division KSB1 bacterium]|nr:hypothetical protein [candidate division KSB1 bacterium]